MGELSSLPNISKVIEGKLSEAGITTIGQLRETGSEEAFRRIRAFDPEACLNMLCALEGAVEGIRWHGLADSRKKELKEFCRQL